MHMHDCWHNFTHGMQIFLFMLQVSYFHFHMHVKDENVARKHNIFCFTGKVLSASVQPYLTD
jgi:hypothetical protein